jgi:hypothetical protein
VREQPVKKLWLENVRIVEGTELVLDRHKYGLPLLLDFSGVETLRLRRLPLSPVEMDEDKRVSARSEFVYSRGGRQLELQNGLGGRYLTSANTLGVEVVEGHKQLERVLLEDENSQSQPSTPNTDQWPLEELMGAAMRFDDAIYKALSEEVKIPAEVVAANIPSHYYRSILAYQDRWPGPVTQLSQEATRMFAQIYRTDLPTAGQCAGSMFQNMAQTLTSLNIDWAITWPDNAALTRRQYESRIKFYVNLFSLRFPHLRAFQYRNAVASETLLPEGLFLFDHSSIFTGNEFERDWVMENVHPPSFEVGLKPLEFFETHPNLQCLAWPMDQFFSHTRPSDISTRVRNVIDKLGQTLVDLRVDDFYNSNVEDHSGDATAMDTSRARESFVLLHPYRH